MSTRRSALAHRVAAAPAVLALAWSAHPTQADTDRARDGQAIVEETTARWIDRAVDESLGRWLDETVEAAIGAHDVPGAVVGIVRAGRPAILRGYGLADIESDVAMDPETTVLPVASVSKVYTAAVVLELAAAGRLDLRGDIAAHVRGQPLDGDFDQRITLAHLLTHTAGFDERNLDRYLPLEHADASVREYLTATLPRRVRPPGHVYQYSNHGMALAGVIAEQATSIAFDRLLEQTVLEPLGMTATSMRTTAPRNAVGYSDRNGRLVAQGPHYVRTAYAGMLVTTAADQVRMIRALLDRTTLAPETIAGLTSRQFSHGQESPGTAFALFEDSWGGAPYFWHEGQTRGFYAGFYVVPEHGLGLFVAYNRHRGALARSVRHGLLERELGPRGRESELVPDAANTAAIVPLVEGTYRAVRHARSTPERIITSMLGRAGEVRVEAEPDGTVRIGRARFEHAHDLLFVEAATGAVNGFLPGSDGEPGYLYYQRSAFERIPFIAREDVRDGWIGLSIIGYGLTLLTWGGFALRRGVPSQPGDARTRARWLQLPGLAAQLVFVVALIAIVGRFRGDTVFDLLFPWPLWMQVVFFLPWVALLLAPLQVVAASVVWRASEVGWLERSHHGALVLLTCWFGASAWTWGLLEPAPGSG